MLMGSMEEMPGTKGDIVELGWGNDEDRFSDDGGRG